MAESPTSITAGVAPPKSNASAGAEPPQPQISKRPNFRLTSEFDSESCLFFHKASCKLFDSLAKLKISFLNDGNGQVSQPHLAFISKYLSLHHDLTHNNTLLKASLDFSSSLRLSATHDVNAQQGEMELIAKLSEPGYALNLSSPVPSVGLPNATLKFPFGELSLEEKEDDETKRMLSINGIIKGQVLNGVCTAHYADEDLKLRYSYKDEEMSFIPALSLTSNALSFAFKRRFSHSDKMSYWYNFDANNWSAVYKHTYGKDLKFKAGYDSEVRLGWASLWVGSENGKTKTAPRKMKIQFMLQVPQDDVKSSVLMFRVKKRWDI